MVDVVVLRIERCPNWELATERVLAAAARLGIEVSMDVRFVTPDDELEKLGFTGSPTILIGGRNPFGGRATDTPACRMYPTDAGLEGAPSIDEIAAALVEAS